MGRCTPLRRLVSGVALAALALLTGCTRAPSAPAGSASGPIATQYSDFQTFCAANAGNATKVIELAQAKGWQDAPPDYQPLDAGSHGHLAWQRGLMTTQGGVVRMVFAGIGTRVGVPISSCLVVQRPLDLDSLHQAQAWAGVPMVSGRSAFDQLFFFSDEKAGHAAVTTDPDLKKAIRGGALRALVIGYDPAKGVSLIQLETQIQP